MYSPGQIIYDKKRKCPVVIGNIWDGKQYPKKHTWLIDNNGDVWTGWEVKGSIAEAQKLLDSNKIRPA